MTSFISELRRRNIFRVAGTYAVVSWIMVQIAAITAASFGAPDWVMKMIIITLVIGFPIAVIMAWAFEMTPEGVRPTESIAAKDSIASQTGRKLDWAILLGLITVGSLMIFAQFTAPQATPQKASLAQTDSIGDAAEPNLSAKSIGTLAAAEPQGQSIAVLPFADYSAAKDQEYFAKGISEELLNVLARIDGLRVASRTSAFAFSGQDKSMQDISRALNVAHILEGSIRKSGDTLRITAQLIDTVHDVHLWSATYDRPLTAKNIFDVQDEIAAAIVAELKGRLSFTPTGAAGRTVSLEAYELYLHAREKANKRLPDPLKASIADYEAVIALDPNFTHAYSGLADSYMLAWAYGALDKNTAQTQALKNIERALYLSPEAAEALTSRSMYANMFERGTGTEEDITFAQRAIAANPNYSVAYHRLGQAYSTHGQYIEGLAAFEKARELDPLSASILNNLARLQRLTGDWKAAKATTEDNIKWNPDQPAGYEALSVLNFDEGNFARAHSLAKDALALNPQSRYAHILLKEVYLKAQMFEQALRIKDDPLTQGLIAFAANDMDAVKKSAAELTDPKDKAFLFYASRQFVEADTYYQKLSVQANYKSAPADIDNLIDFANILAVFNYTQNPDAALYESKLATYFGDKQAADYDLQVSILSGAIFKAQSQAPDSALPWIDRMIALGQVDNILKEPAFDPLRETPAFEARLAAMNANQENLRQSISAQLAAPKPNWVTAD